MSYRIVVQPTAERDIEAVALRIEAQSNSVDTALRWIRSLRGTIDTLKTNPKRCPVDPDSVVYGEEVRVLAHGKRRGSYRVLFAIRGHSVHILTVRHSARRSLSEELELDDSTGDDFTE